MRKPRIGLTVKRGRPFDHPKNRYYIERLEEQGAEVVLLNGDDVSAMLEIARTLDGFLLGGGGDVHPGYYDAPWGGTNRDSVDLVRDELELHLVEIAVKRQIPVLGICRGFQVLNVALGGTLIQHMAGHSSKGQEHVTMHWVRVRPYTRLWEALGRVERLLVNSHHHQGVGEKDLASGLVTSAWIEDDPDVIEGIESPTHPWLIGVQWHPERLQEFEGIAREAQRHLFRSFVHAASLIPTR